MPKLIRFYVRHVAIGFGLATVFVAALLWLNIANLQHLIFTSDIGPMALGLLWFFNGLVFGGAQTAVAVLVMADSDDEPPQGGTLVPVSISDD